MLPKGWAAIPDDIIVKNGNKKTVEVVSFEEAVENAKKFFGRE